jgi:beta-ribofuranosylaminobenzene 5'-phosphate synthase
MGILNPSHSNGRRRYGSVGVSIEEPRTVVEVEPADTLEVTSSSIVESKAFARKTLEYYKLNGAKIDVLSLPQRHVGLGSTTQLSLSIATGITRAYGLDINPVELATILGRGKQSAIGTYVFQQGGFVIEGGWGEKTIFPPLLSRYSFPEDWRLLIVIPEKRGLDETQELEAFERLRNPKEELVNEACYRLFLGMAPAVLEKNIHAFGENLTRLQEIVGGMFSQAQCGVFQPESAPLIKRLKDIGAVGVGQSSWGPTVYSLFDSEKSKRVEDLLKKEILRGVFISESNGSIRGDSKWGRIHFTRADNKGALVTALHQ